jgi:histidyl-tRNA synthetase
MEAIGVTDETTKLTVLRAIDKVDRLGVTGVTALLGEGRRDESGDYTKGAGLSSTNIQVVLGVVEQRKDWRDTIAAADIHLAKSKIGQSGVSELEEIAKLVGAARYEDRVKIDPSVVRGLEYYTGPVFEVELLIETKDEKGRPVRFGSVGGGGRYDGLVSRFRGETVPATGFSIGVSRLQAALSLIGKLDDKKVQGPVVVTVFDKDRIAGYQAMVAQLRNADIRAELYLGNPKNLGNQLKYADKRNAPCVIIQGTDEKANGTVTIKDLTLGAELAGDATRRDEYLHKQQQAQRTVPLGDLVKEVQAILARRS